MSFFKVKIPTFMLMTASLATSCQTERFRASNPEIRVGNRDLSFTCVAGAKASTGEETVVGAEGTQVKVKGQFCTQDLTPTPPSETTIVLLNDFSGSMEDSTGGSDPLRADGSCGRREAAVSITDALVRISEQTSNTQIAPSIKMTSIVFGSSAKENIGISTPQNFKSSINADNFCGHNMGGTNYQAAFEAASNKIKSIPGSKIVIAITDGMPTSYGTFLPTENSDLAKSKGATAAADLTSIANTSLYIVYLKNAAANSLGLDPLPYLLSLVNNQSDHVKIAENAADLTNQIKLIELPKSGNVASGGALASFSSPLTNGVETVAVNIKPVDTARGIWEYETAAISLRGSKGQTIPYSLKVTAKSDQGAPLESNVTINFNRTF